MLHLDVWNILFHVINVLILCLLVRRFLLKPVNGIMEKRKVLIDEQFAEAKQAKEEAQAILSQQDRTIEEAQNKAEDILEEAREKGRREYGKILQDAQQEVEAAMKKADLESKLMKEKALRQAEQEIAGLALSAASKILEGTDNNAGGRASLYDEFLKRAGKQS